MKWISDGDEQRIRSAHKVLLEDKGISALVAKALLEDVLRNIHTLAQEQPHPAPRIRELSEAEQRVFYPERYK